MTTPIIMTKISRKMHKHHSFYETIWIRQKKRRVSHRYRRCEGTFSFPFLSSLTHSHTHTLTHSHTHTLLIPRSSHVFDKLTFRALRRCTIAVSIFFAAVSV